SDRAGPGAGGGSLYRRSAAADHPQVGLREAAASPLTSYLNFDRSKLSGATYGVTGVASAPPAGTSRPSAHRMPFTTRRRIDGCSKSPGCPSVVKKTRPPLCSRVHATGCTGGNWSALAVL